MILPAPETARAFCCKAVTLVSKISARDDFAGQVFDARAHTRVNAVSAM